jgi:hypothetical protein
VLECFDDAARVKPYPFEHCRREHTMTREEAFARCPADSYVEYYGNQWLVVPFARVVQPEFFDCTPGLRLTHA